MDTDKPESSDIEKPAAEDMATAPSGEPAVEFLEPRRRKGVGFGVVLFMSLLAAVIGVVGGGAASRVIDQYMPGASGPDLRAELNAANETAETLSARLANLEARPETANNNPDLTALEARITALESRAVVTASGEAVDPGILRRIEALETGGHTAPVDVQDIQARLAALEAVSKSGENSIDGGPATAPAVLERLAALESAEPLQTDPAIIERLTALENREFPVIPEPVDLSPLLARLEALEQQSSSLRAEFDDAVAKRAAVPLPAFPRAEIVAAVSTITEEDKGWIGRTLNKHVRVRDESLVLIVDDIEALLLQGNVDGALARVEDLPTEGREAAKAWVEAVKLQRTSL